jgi:hypothetical protein
MSEKPWFADEPDDDDFCEHGMPIGFDCSDCDEEESRDYLKEVGDQFAGRAVPRRSTKEPT